jgi:hypothetical protein
MFPVHWKGFVDALFLEFESFSSVTCESGSRSSRLEGFAFQVVEVFVFGDANSMHVGIPSKVSLCFLFK